MLPRKLRGDRFAGSNDEVYPALERAEGALPKDLHQLAIGQATSSKTHSSDGIVAGVEPIKMDADEDRKPRTMEEMVKEAEWLQEFFKDVERSEESTL